MKDLLKKAQARVWLEGDPARNHAVGLIVFGTLEIVLGILAFALAMFLLVVVSANGLAGMKPVHFWMAQGFLFCTTLWFIAMGMGSISARRWARALMLAGSWISVFFGSLVMALVLYILPETYNLVADSGLLPASAVLGVVYFSVFMLLLLQVVFPLVAIVFYGLKGVQGTCERLNPDPCWSDRCPLPLLAMVFVAGLGCLPVVAGISTNHAVFLFGRVLDGWRGFAVLLAVSAACVYVGWGAFARKVHAWWAAYALVFATSASMMLTFSETAMDELYIGMGYSSDQIVHLEQLQFLNPAVFTFATCVWGVMACIYLIWVRDRFVPEEETVEVKSYQQRKAEAEAGRASPPRRPRMRLD